MLIATRQLYRCSMEGPEGDLGRVKDVLFDREDWKVRYLDVDVGGWLQGRRVILSPEVIVSADYGSQRLVTRLTKEQIEASPPVESHLPVSRRKEIEAARHFAWGAYWANVELSHREDESEDDPSLHSARSVSGYRVGVSDGDLGHVTDFIVDDGALKGGPWEVRYLVVDTRNWLPGRHVLVPPLWAESIDWNTRHVNFSMAREKIEDSPEYDPNAPVNREYEEVFHDYYGRPVYWRQVEHSA